MSNPRRGRPKGGKNNPSQLPFKTAEVTRAIRGALNIGLAIGRVDVNPRTGLISIIPAAPQAVADHRAAVAEKA